MNVDDILQAASRPNFNVSHGFAIKSAQLLAQEVVRLRAHPTCQRQPGSTQHCSLEEAARRELEVFQAALGGLKKTYDWMNQLENEGHRGEEPDEAQTIAAERDYNFALEHCLTLAKPEYVTAYEVREAKDAATRLEEMSIFRKLKSDLAASRQREAGLRAAANAVNLNALGRSGGSVYMVNKAEFLALRAALASAPPADSEVERLRAVAWEAVKKRRALHEKLIAHKTLDSRKSDEFSSTVDAYFAAMVEQNKALDAALAAASPPASAPKGEVSQ